MEDKDLLELTINTKELNPEMVDDLIDALIEVVKTKADGKKYVNGHRYGYTDMDRALDVLFERYGDDALTTCALYSSYFSKDPDYLHDVAKLQIKYLMELGIIKSDRKCPASAKERYEYIKKIENKELEIHERRSDE